MCAYFGLHLKLVRAISPVRLEVVPDPHLDVDGRLLESTNALGSGQFFDVLAGDAEDLVSLP